MLRSIAAGFVGLIVAGMVVGLFEGVSGLLHPAPPGLDFTDAAAASAYLATLPTSALLVVVVGWFAGPLAGVAVARRIAPGRVPAIVVSVVQVCFVVLNFVQFPHPVWMMIAGPIASLAGSKLGWMLGQRKA